MKNSAIQKSSIIIIMTNCCCYCHQVGGRVFVAGQIPLVPGTMQLVSGGAGAESRLSLRHVRCVLEAACPGRGLHDVLLCLCYLTHPDLIPPARRQWEEGYSAEQEQVR